MNQLAIAIAIVLFPGLIASIICDKVAVHSPRWESFKYGIYSFVFGILCYLLLQALYCLKYWVFTFPPNMAPSSPPLLAVWSLVTTQTTSLKPSEVFLATSLAPVIAALSASVANHKLINRVAQKLRISTKYGDENLFSFFLNAKEVDWVYVRDKSGELTYQGRVTSFSETDSIQELVLSEVSVFEYETSAELYSVPLVYLSKPTGSFMIEVIPNNLLEPTHAKETDN